MAEISGATLWRWLSRDALRPWRFRSWIFPRDPAFVEKAGRILDFYAGVWEGVPLTASDSVLCADEKTSIQARRRRHAEGPGEYRKNDDSRPHRRRLIERGIFKMPSNLKRNHVSYSHTEAQVDKTLEACEDVLKELVH